MSALIRLYPAAWRERYGDELVELLAERPLSLGDSVDLVRGAVDAHLHRVLAPAAVGPNGSTQVPTDLPAVRRRVPAGAFLGTLAAGLFVVTAGSILVQTAIPHVAVQLTSTLLALASYVLGLAVWATSGRGFVAKLAGAAFAGGLVFVFWTNTFIPAVLALVAGSVLLTVGSLIERQPSRAIGALTAGLALALWTSYRSEQQELIEIAIAGYAVVAVALARSQGGSTRPIIAGVAGTIAAVALVWVVMVATSPRVLHAGFAVHCGDLARQDCLARIDDVVQRYHRARPSDMVTDGRIDENGAAEICATIAISSGGRSEPESWIGRMETDTTLGIQMVGGHREDDTLTATCWRRA